jgi:hypothetical protein
MDFTLDPLGLTKLMHSSLKTGARLVLQDPDAAVWIAMDHRSDRSFGDRMRHRFSRLMFAATVLAIIGLARTEQATAADLPMPLEKVWAKALQTIALDGMAISASDQQSGVIQFTGSFGHNSGLFDCPRAGGALTKRVYTGTLVLKANTNGTTFVMIQTTGAEHRYRNHHILFFTTGSESFENACRSTGRLETAFIQRLAAT